MTVYEAIFFLFFLLTPYTDLTTIKQEVNFIFFYFSATNLFDMVRVFTRYFISDLNFHLVSKYTVTIPHQPTLSIRRESGRI